MSSRENYQPGPAAGAEVRKEGDNWTLVLVRELRHPPTKVWQALTDPAQLREWAPFDADRSLASAGTVKLTTVSAPTPQVSETIVKRAEAPKLLRYISWGAAGWHICFDVLDRFLAGEPIGRRVGMETMKFEGWQRLQREYARHFDAS
jgi:hypothetical protein